jgi:hypothetical protein
LHPYRRHDDYQINDGASSFGLDHWIIRWLTGGRLLDPHVNVSVISVLAVVELMDELTSSDLQCDHCDSSVSRTEWQRPREGEESVLEKLYETWADEN